MDNVVNRGLTVLEQDERRKTRYANRALLNGIDDVFVMRAMTSNIRLFTTAT